MDKEEFVSLVSSALSSVGIASAVLWQYVSAVPVFAIILSASLAFFFARVNSRDTRKYEVRKIAILEALGPIYGQILKIQESFDSSRANLTTTSHYAWIEEWDGIRHSHRFFVIEEPLRSMIQAYFDRLKKFTASEYLTIGDVFSVEKQTWPKVFHDVQSINNPAMVTAWKDGERFFATLQGALYWGVDPNNLEKGEYSDLILSGSKEGTRQEQFSFQDPQVIRDAIDKFWRIAYQQLTSNQRFVSSQKERYSVMEETARLRHRLEEEFTRWAR